MTEIDRWLRASRALGELSPTRAARYLSELESLIAGDAAASEMLSFIRELRNAVLALEWSSQRFVEAVASEYRAFFDSRAPIESKSI